MTAWSRTPARHLYAVVDERNTGHHTQTMLSVSVHRGVVRRTEVSDRATSADSLDGYKLVRAGEIVINRMSAYEGALGIARESGIVSPEYIVIRPAPNTEGRFLAYLFKSSGFIGEMAARVRGIGSIEQGNVRTPRLNPADLGRIDVRVPELESQRRIADYLDVKTARIDELINRRQGQAEAVEQLMQTTIDMTIDRLSTDLHAVTLPLKRFVDHRRPITYGIVQAGPDYAGGTPYVRPVDMYRHSGVPNPALLLRTSPEIAAAYARSMLRTGDVVVTIGPSYGKTMVVPEALSGANLTQGTARVAPRAGISAKFIVWTLRHSRAIAYWNAAVGGATFRALNLEPLSRTPIPDLPASAQAEIVARLDQTERGITSLLKVIGSQANLLVERRSAMITAAVSGKLEIPGVAA